MRDPYNLQRFVEAQEGTIETALRELRAGRKHSHWMWFIFPQLAVLGRSPTAKFFGIRDVEEAAAYLAHPLLGARLRQCVQILMSWAGKRKANEILGSIDAMKLRSCLTLFDLVEEDDGSFGEALASFFTSPDERTLAQLNDLE